MKKMALILLLFSSFSLMAQTDTTELKSSSSEEVETFTLVTNMPVFPGCEYETDVEERNRCSEIKVRIHLASNVKYPQEMKDKRISGTVYVQYIINEMGEVDEVKVLRGILNGQVLDDEAVKAIKLLPKMKPATLDGEPVRVQYTIPIRFNLPELDLGKETKRKKRKRRKRR